MQNSEDPGFEPRVFWLQPCALSSTPGTSLSCPQPCCPPRSPQGEVWGEGRHEEGLFPPTPLGSLGQLSFFKEAEGRCCP